MSGNTELCPTSSQRLVDYLLGPKDGTKGAPFDNSIYARLKKYVGKPDELLDPCPEINRLFGELVSYLQGVPDMPGLHAKDQFAFVEREACFEIDNDDLLYSRASAIRALACRAESRLETFWAEELIKADITPDPSMPAVEKVRTASGAFPYIQNYVDMVKKEGEVILSHLPNELATMHPGSVKGMRNARLEMAFCGSGPLPLTGILLAASLNANVTLIEIDPTAVDLSRRLIAQWEAKNVIRREQVRVVCADGGKIRFHASTPGYGRQVPCSHVKCVKCDVLFLAALIPNSTKEQIAQNVSEMRSEGPLLILRTAHGLTARLAYFQNRRDVMSRYLSFVGLVAPCVHELQDGFIVDDEVQPLEFFSKEILNSLELYRWKKPEPVR